MNIAYYSEIKRSNDLEYNPNVVGLNEQEMFQHFNDQCQSRRSAKAKRN